MTAVLRSVRTPRSAVGRPVERAVSRTGGRTAPAAGIGTAGLLAVTAFFVGLMVLANFHVVVIGDQFEFDRLERRLETGLEQAQVLRYEVARLESPDRILRVAEGRLGMKWPKKRFQLAIVRFGDEVGLAAPVGDPFAGENR
jgi:hypothetical protein